VIPFKRARRADPTTTKHVERQHKCPDISYYPCGSFSLLAASIRLDAEVGSIW